MFVFKMLFTFDGRIRRRDFWLYSIGSKIFLDLFNALTNKILWHGNFLEGSLQWLTHPLTPLGLIMIATLFLGCWIDFCLLAKRGHDRNRPIYISAINIGAILIAGILSSSTMVFPNFGNYWTFIMPNLLIIPIVLWILVDYGCLDGNEGPNRYGSSPKKSINEQDVF